MAGPSRKGNCSQREPQRGGRQPQEPDQRHVPHQDRCRRPQQVKIILKNIYSFRFKKSLKSIPKLDTYCKKLKFCCFWADLTINCSCQRMKSVFIVFGLFFDFF